MKRVYLAAPIARFCDFWWLVVTDARIAPLDENPNTWGLLAPSPDATRLRVLKEPARLEAQPLTKSFVASLLRNVSDGMVSKASVDAKVEDAHAQGVKVGEARAADVKELERLRRIAQDVITFEQASGVTIAQSWGCTAGPKKLGEALKSLIAGDEQLAWKVTHLEQVAERAAAVAEQARKQVEHVKAAAALIVRPEVNGQAAGELQS